MSLAESRDVLRFGPPAVTARDEIAVERPLELRLGGVPIAVLMCSPGLEEALALGFCLTEGILVHPAELVTVDRIGEGDRFALVTAPGVHIDPEQFRRNAYTTSSCGVCGKASIDAVRVAARPLPAGPVLDPRFIAGLPELLRAGQTGFDTTGGLHAAGLISPAGEMLAFAEDVGRHNAVDKVIGLWAREQWPMGELILQVSGRVSFEIAQKAAVAGIPVVSGVSATSSLAVELAEETGMTLTAFARDGGFVVYAGGHRFG